MINYTHLLNLTPGFNPHRLSSGFTFSPDVAGKYITFIEKLKHTKGRWGGTLLQLEPWQKCVIANLFGWHNVEGLRRFRKMFMLIARKNSKSTMGAAIALAILCLDKEPGCEVYSIAADRSQASVIFDIARRMVEQNAVLSQVITVYRNHLVYRNPYTGDEGFYKVLSSDAGTKHGLNPHAILADEVHAHKSRELFDVLTSGQGARSQPLVLSFTTAGWNKHSLCYEEYEYAQKVRDGVIDDPEYYPVLYCAGNKEDWEDPKVWEKANPNLGVSVSPEFLRAEHNKAKAIPAYESAFRRLYLCQWTESETRWLSMSDWDACFNADFDVANLKGQPCFAGLDLSATTDLTALVLWFPLQRVALPFFFIPGESIKKRADRDHVPYEVWQRQGHIYATPGSTVDYQAIRRKLNDLKQLHKIKDVAIDRHFNCHALAGELEHDGFTVTGFGQGFVSMSTPTKELERLTISHEFNHLNHPVLRWCAQNVAVEFDAAGNIKPSKKKSTERIDGVVALVMAIGRAMAHEIENKPTVYKHRGLLSI